MGHIEDFVSEYERQFDFWEAAARNVRGILETELASSGLRAIVTSRAKSVDRLMEKLRGRDRTRQYHSVTQIRNDIVDLAGVRVALYFPGQIEEADRVIRETLAVEREKRFPPAFVEDGNAESRIEVPGGKSRVRRFSGYGARHFHARVPASRLSAGHERYASAIVEIQVASVLMHAWSEVEHDLVYKPLEGDLSPSEYALLDQLNGLVLAGEIALEQLQKAGDARVAAAETPFRNHYELAEFLRTRLAEWDVDLTETTLGRVDVLFDYLAERSSPTRAMVEPYIELLERDIERRPVAAQLADLMFSGDESQYNAYLQAMAAARHSSSVVRRKSTATGGEQDEKLALGEFVAAWVLFENLLQRLDLVEGGRSVPLSVQLRALAGRGLLSQLEHDELSQIRGLRNHVFHGRVSDVPPSRLRDASARLRELTNTIEQKSVGRGA